MPKTGGFGPAGARQHNRLPTFKNESQQWSAAYFASAAFPAVYDQPLCSIYILTGSIRLKPIGSQHSKPLGSAVEHVHCSLVAASTTALICSVT
jgi:hypothetical protein